ncbi:MAG: glycine cleavage protein aminomethyl transferase [Acidobacteriales bacterium]|nr:glycine cleavage protein aminomethyl transferase [Terriglobales bacterium]
MTVAGTNTKTALADKLANSGAALAEYSGAETAAHFLRGTNAEFAAITETCGVYDLGWRGKISVTGDDRARWLNGMVTNNIKDLPLNCGNYNFLLNAQGRIQGDMYAYNRGEQILLDTERSQVEHLSKTLDHFIIMDDVELSDASEKITSIGVQGPKSAEVLKAIGIEPNCADPLLLCDVSWNGNPISVTRMVSDEYLTFEISLAPEIAPALWDALVSAGAIPTGTDALEKFRVLAGVPKYGTDIRDRDLPQETEQKHALNFTKGCYIGQEIVERIRSRGNVHRAFTGFILDANAERGSKVIAKEKEMGELTSVATVPLKSGERTLALGYIRREAGGPGTQVSVAGTTGTIASLPFKF